jgi:hypothetical protein
MTVMALIRGPLLIKGERWGRHQTPPIQIASRDLGLLYRPETDRRLRCSSAAPGRSFKARDRARGAQAAQEPDLHRRAILTHPQRPEARGPGPAPVNAECQPRCLQVTRCALAWPKSSGMYRRQTSHTPSALRMGTHMEGRLLGVRRSLRLLPHGKRK